MTMTGINYYERYDQTWMFLLTMYSYLLWLVFIASAVVNLRRNFQIQLFHGLLVDIAVSLIFIRGNYLIGKAWSELESY